MTYDSVKNGLVSILKGLGYAESQEPFDIQDMTPSEYGNTFILKSLSGELFEGPEGGETLVDRFYDTQNWQVQIAFDRAGHNEVVNLDTLHREKDKIIKKLDNPSNWSSFVRVCKYKSWEVREADNYFMLVINVMIIDTYTY